MVTINTRAGGGIRNNKLVFLAIAILMAIVFVGALTFLSNVYQTEEYYVVNQEVPTRTQVTPEMLKKVVTTKGTAPAGLTPADVQSGTVYTRYPLAAGDLLTLSNTGGLADIAVGIPDSWVITSFSVPADQASAGRITRGVYFDMLIVNENGSYYPFVNMLAIDTSVSVTGASNPGAIDSEEAKTGQTQIYYVGMTPGDAARLQTLMANPDGTVQLILSPRENDYQEPNIEAYTGPENGIFTFEFDGTPQNVNQGTDPTFTDVERDEMGRPTNVDSDGNVEYPARCGNNPSSEPNASGECEAIDNNTYSSATTE